MKKALAVLIYILQICILGNAQVKPFRLAFISDTHIGSPDGKAEEDLTRTITDLNKQTGIDFAVITGDITELGTDAQLASAKRLLDKLNMKYYIIPGNHDDGWSESGGASFISTFGSDRFTLDHNGIRFIGCASGPYVRMSDGHIPREAMNWVHTVLDSTPSSMPVIFLNHYPINNQLDNWYEVIDLLKQHNTVLIMCGHGHANKAFEFEDIPGVMGRSNLRAKSSSGGYNLVDITADTIFFAERNPVSEQTNLWTKVKLEHHLYDSLKKFPRPDYSINLKYQGKVRTQWKYTSDANIISTPVVVNNLVVFGNQNGVLTAISLKNGIKKWSVTTGGAIYSSPATSDKRIVFGSSDGYIYCINLLGEAIWKIKTGAAVLGSPLIRNNIVYIGGSDHVFRALQLKDGNQIWAFNKLDGPVVSTPVICKDHIIFGAWDTFLYSLNLSDGSLNWSWSNGSTIRNYSPASCIPVVHDNVIYIVAPDRYLTAIDATTGKTLWRTNESTVRESIGISPDGSTLYAKTMNDTLVAYHTSHDFQKASWKMNAGYGYEHVPSMLIEKDKKLYFGTRNGVVYSIDIRKHEINWAYKIDNSMVNTIRPYGNSIIASTMDGKLVYLTSE